MLKNLKKDHLSLIRKIISCLLDNIVLYSLESPAFIDEYRLKARPAFCPINQKLPFYFTETKKYILNEPRIYFFKEILLALLLSGDFFNNGRKVSISGFSIKNKNSFLQKYRTNPGSIIQLFRIPCRIHCEYCYQDGVPGDFPFNVRKIDHGEINDRIEHFSMESELFPRVIYNVDETLSHPLFFEGMSRLRQKTTDIISIYTNGEALTCENINKLSSLMPLLVNLSMTSSNPETRTRVTRDRNPEIAINSIKEMKRREIPFEITLVAWPTISMEDLEKTISYADDYSPMYIKVILPGYSRFYKKPFKENSLDYNLGVIRFIRKIRSRYRTDIIFDLNKLEEIDLGLDPIEPRISYVTANSPARKAGIEKGQVIYSIMGKRVFFRLETIGLINAFERIIKKTDIDMAVIDNSGNKKNILIKKDLFADSYPYFTWQKDLGIHIGDGIEPNAITQINHIISRTGSKNTVFMSSYLMKYSLSNMLDKWIRIKEGVNFRIHIPKNHFWGGNIIVGDLLTVEDFIIAIKEVTEKHPETDLVIIPSSPFSSWKRDLKGDLYYRIKRSFGINIEMLHYPRMYS